VFALGLSLLASELSLISTFSGSFMGVNDSSPLDSFNISAPNWWRAVIVDGVGSGILWINNIIWHNVTLKKYVFGAKKEKKGEMDEEKESKFYLDSGSHNSWVLISKVDNSVSVEPAEWAWFGVDGKLVLIKRFHVFFLSAII
jgi:hypothetical protein